MESFSIMGIAAFIMAASLMSLPSRIRAINKTLKRLQKNSEEIKNMSKLLEELVGKKCAIYTHSLGTVGTVLAVDEDWVKIEIDSKKKQIKLIPLDSIDSIEIRD